jgi:hypothetical protein
MSTPFSQQRLKRDFAADLKADLNAGRAVSGEDLLRAVEQRTGALPAELRELFHAFSIPAVPRKGRPPNNRAALDFTMKDLDERYSSLLEQFRSEDVSPSRPDYMPPSERAYRQLLDEFRDDFSNIDWLALRNEHSAWRNRRFHSSEGFVDSEDFEAEIERQFPTQKK